MRDALKRELESEREVLDSTRSAEQSRAERRASRVPLDRRPALLQPRRARDPERAQCEQLSPLRRTRHTAL